MLKEEGNLSIKMEPTKRWDILGETIAQGDFKRENANDSLANANDSIAILLATLLRIYNWHYMPVKKISENFLLSDNK